MTQIDNKSPDADRAIALMQRAAEASRSDAFRFGFVIELPSEGEALVTGDLHGNRANLQRIIQLSNLQRHPKRHLVLQELVHDLETEDDVCRSYRLVEIAAQLKSAFPNQAHILLGNHEFSEMLNLEIGKRGRELNEPFEQGMRAAYGERWEEVKNAYRVFWRGSPLVVRTANRVLVSHSTPRLDRMDDLTLDYLRTASPDAVFHRDGPVFAMLWDRDYRPEAAEAFARRMQAEVLIVGHTPCRDGWRIPNDRHVVLDCKDLEARYALLPLDRELSQRQILAYVHKLYR